MSKVDFSNPIYEQKLKDEIHKRLLRVDKCKKDHILRSCLIEKCEKDIKFFFDNFLWTNKNSTFFSDELPHTIPFELFDYQRDIVDEIWGGIQNKESIFIEKSRQLGLTWVILGIFLYGFLFHNHKYLIISRTSDEVDKKGDVNSCFERIRFMLQMIPQWMLPEGFDKTVSGKHNKFMALVRPDTPASITGESANPNASRGGTYNAIFMDEMGFMSDATAINRSASQATPCRIMNSTPNGEFGEYFKMKELAKKGKLKGLTLKWDLNPFYSQEWYNWKTSDMLPEQIAQELEISYSLSLKGRVYKQFEERPMGVIDIGVQYEYDYTLPLYLSMDNSHGGQDPFAVILAQITREGKIQIFDCVETVINPTQMAHFMAKQPIHSLLGHELNFIDRFKKYKTPVYVADPYDTNTKLNQSTINEEFQKQGIYLNTPKPQQGANGNLVEQIRITSNNLDRIQMHPRCKDFIRAIKNARYPERKEGHSSTQPNMKPVHDPSSHYRTALEYLILYLTQNIDNQLKKKKIKIQVPNHVTGEITEKWIEV